jgi:hypothetical protein
MPAKAALVAGALKLWSFVPSGGSLPEPVWSSRRQFLVGLTWFHVAVIAMLGPILGFRWDLDPGAFVRDGTVLHTIAEASWPSSPRSAAGSARIAPCRRRPSASA